MNKKFFIITIILFLFLFIVQCEKYNYKIVDGKYKIDNLDEFIKVFNKALKEKDNDTIIMLSKKNDSIIYDDENFKGHNATTKEILESGFDYDLCLRVLNNEYEVNDDKISLQAYIPKYKRKIDEKYTIILDNKKNSGWLFTGLFLIQYEYTPTLNKK